MENYYIQPGRASNIIAEMMPAGLSNYSLNHLPKEALEVMKLLDEVREFTSSIRNKLMSEFNHADPIHLKLDTI